MIGPRVGTVVGVAAGVAVGVSADELGGGTANPMAGVTRDATSGIYRPSNATEWTTTLAVAGLGGGNPTGLWLCQDASGDLADAIGSNPLVVSGAPAYRQSNTGWTTKSFNITATTVQAAILAAGVFNPAADSIAWLGYCCLTGTPGGNRNVLTLTNNATGIRVDHTVANKLQMTCGANTATSANTYTTSTIFPIAIVYNRTATSCKLYTELEELTVTYASVGDGNKGIGAVQSTGDSTAHWNMLTAFSSTAAELSTANMRSLLQTLAWSPAF
jgi:hypothetical protein